MAHGDFFHPITPPGDGSFTWYPADYLATCRRLGITPSDADYAEYLAEADAGGPDDDLDQD